MRYGSLDIVAPRLLCRPWHQAEALGSAVWLWMHSPAHRGAPLGVLPAVLVPAIKSGQFVLATQAGKPVFYLSWASFSEDAEARYLSNPPEHMPEEDWASGDRVWLLDWVAPFGHTRMLRHLVAQLFSDRCLRALQHRGDERGLRVMEFKGIGVLNEEARAWFVDHPIASTKRHFGDNHP